MLARLFVIVAREYLERVRSKAFLIGTILGPILLVGFSLGPGLIMAKTTQSMKLAILDESGKVAETLTASLGRQKLGDRQRFVLRPLAPGETEQDLRQHVMQGRLDGLLLVPEDAVETSRATYVGKSVSNINELRAIEGELSQVLTGLRLADVGIDPARAHELTRRVDLTTVRLSKDGTQREDRGVGIILAVVLLMMIYVTVLMWGQTVMASVIEEKSSRIVEVLASTVPSPVLLAGKLLGVGGAGLTQFLVWSATLGLVSAASLTLAPGLDPALLPEVTPLILGGLVVFFLLGYFLYSALFAAIGAAVNTTQEAQSLVMIAMAPLIAGMVLFPIALQAPDGMPATVLSLIPIFTPLLMFVRIVVLTPPLWQIALSIALTLAAIVGALWVAARIYRVGILMYGKKPTFPELVRWLRHS